ncbi:LysR family transcriptional regulator [Vibrio amylolyticus]|uniref:LysR family transcriptional regulator n=1 Tax=Vibrio amylolyticus TaxID=2847292 RepID=UPI00354DB90D
MERSLLDAMANNLYTNIDLNLLRVFSILFQEKNMRLTAARLSVTQPAISKSLYKLRLHFEDDLFVKSSKGLTPTPYGEELYSTISPILDSLEVSLNNRQEFDPKELAGMLTIAISPRLMSAISSKMFLQINQSAPNLKVTFRTWNQNTQNEIENGEIDLGISYSSDFALKSLVSQKVGSDHLHLICREGHPHQGDTISLQEATKYPIGHILTPNWNDKTTTPEYVAEKHGVKLNVALSSELPLVILEAVQFSDMIAPVSRFSNYEQLKNIRIIKLDLSEDIVSPDIYSYFHNKNDKTEKIHWLMNIAKSVLPEE